MRISGLLLLAIPFVSATVLSVTSRDDQISVNPPIAPEDLHSPLDVTRSGTTATEAPETNAQRLARGLGPLSPKSVHGHSTSHRRPTRVHAARAGPSPTSLAGVLQVIKADGTNMGYVGKDFNIYGEYGLTDQVTDALPVSASAPADGSNFDLLNQNADQMSMYPFVGLTNGFGSSSDEMSPTTFNYAYLSGVQQSQAGSPQPATNDKPNSFSVATGIPKSSESLIWTYDAATGNLKASWYNTDGTLIPMQLVYYAGDDVIVATASADQFRSVFGANGNPDITIKFVSA